VNDLLDRFQENDEEEEEERKGMDDWAREMDDAHLDMLVGRLEALLYSLPTTKEHNSTVLRAVFRDVKRVVQ
jgi:hypothetical protein